MYLCRFPSVHHYRLYMLVVSVSHESVSKVFCILYLVVFQDLVGKFNFHNYDNLRFTSKKINPCKRKQENQTHEVVNLLFGAYNGDVSALRRLVYNIAESQ